MKECITHHHACDCREAKFAEMESENVLLGLQNAELERENAALRADKERLDWMSSKQSNSAELRWTDDIRAAIDAARKEGK